MMLWFADTNVFRITVATLFSFIAAALAGTHHFCYSAVASASVVLILPVSINTLKCLFIIVNDL